MIFKLELWIRGDENRKDVARALKDAAKHVVDVDKAMDGGIGLDGKPFGTWAFEKITPRSPISVQPEWCARLPLQMQSVLLLGARGPDGVGKFHPCKDVIRAYRGCVFLAAKYGRLLQWGEKADDFMSLEKFADERQWELIVGDFKRSVDDLQHHYLLHLLHGVEILAYKHPETPFRDRWLYFYNLMVDDMHLRPEPESVMDMRLGDWGRKNWKDPERVR